MYFQNLDALIQTTLKKIESFKQLKSASMISMFPQNGETKPRIRFNGFNDEWSDTPAGELFKTFDERNRPDLPVLSACQDVRGMAPRSESGYDISHNKSNEVTYKRVIPGQFVIHLRSFQGGFAHSAVEGITSPAYTVFGFKDASLHSDYFWKYIFMSKAFINRLRLITYGIRDGRSISFKEFAELRMLYPSKKEQHMIAAFFANLDHRISLETQRLEKLKQIKSACLDKMFV
jgi:type I restriction enzyme S subunit